MNPWRIAAGLTVFTVVYAFQQPFRQYPGVEYGDFPLPADYQEKTECAFARLMYPPAPGGYGRGRYGRGFGAGFDPLASTHGNSISTQDDPRADPHFVQP